MLLQVLVADCLCVDFTSVFGKDQAGSGEVRIVLPGICCVIKNQKITFSVLIFEQGVPTGNGRIYHGSDTDDIHQKRKRIDPVFGRIGVAFLFVRHLSGLDLLVGVLEATAKQVCETAFLNAFKEREEMSSS